MKKSFLVVFIFLFANQLHAQNYKLLIGTYTNKGTSEGIYAYDFDSKTAETKLLNVAKTENPSYLTLSANKKIIYSVNEAGKNSAVSSFSFDEKSGEIDFIDKKSTDGGDPCYIATNTNQIILANYSGGSIEVFYTSVSGKFLTPKQLVQHTGKSIDPKRQLSSHVHQVQLTPDKKYLISTDLGEDKIYIYNFSRTHARELILRKTIQTNAGSGPRHLTFSPNGKFAFLAHEFNGKITAFSYHDGDLSKIQEIETIAKDFKGKIDGADIHVSEDGKFLYETNRGDANTISVFSIAENGTLKWVETTSTLGKGPRNFTIDPSGNFLLVAHQYTNDVVIFNRNKATGMLRDSGKRINVGIPVCLVFNR
jgi:6-phosphogluconolactonase